jgi:hypothetical protein
MSVLWLSAVLLAALGALSGNGCASHTALIHPPVGQQAGCRMSAVDVEDARGKVVREEFEAHTYVVDEQGKQRDTALIYRGDSHEAAWKACHDALIQKKK